MPNWLIIVAWISVVLGIATAATIAADVLRHPQRMPIMNIVWPVTGLYFPVLGWWLYRALSRPKGAAKLDGEQPHWKGIFLSATHCGSGCVLGDIIGAPIVFTFGWTLLGRPLYADYVVEFALAYLFGIAFQYFPIRAMGKVSPQEAILDAIKADTLSLIAFEVGMFGWMAISNFLLFPNHHPEPSMIVFWFMMQAGMVLGFLTTYPANWLLIRWGIKQGM